MKKTTCAELRGACDAEICGATPEEMGDNCKKHVMEMLAGGDEAHQAAVASMQELTPEQQQAWFTDFAKNFDSLPDVA